MGGKVFPDFTRRYDAEEYFELVPEVLSIAETFSSKCTVIPAYASKESFGDMDVLFVQTKPLDAQLLDSLFYSGGNVSHNGGVWSLVHKGFQIDLINTPDDEFDYALNYFRFNDRGNLVGRLAHKLGLKHGHDGLWFPVRSADHTLGEVLLTNDPIEAEKFLDVVSLDSADTLEVVFENVAASKYFNPDIFLLENRNHTARTRDRKRSTYTAFLEWCKNLPEREYYQFEKDKTVYHKKIFKAFPHTKKEFDALWRRKLMVDQAATMFNGDIVKEATLREGTDLGELMKVLKTELTPEVVVHMPDSEIYSTIMKHHVELRMKESLK